MASQIIFSESDEGSGLDEHEYSDDKDDAELFSYGAASLPDPREIPNTKTKNIKSQKCMQTIAGVAGNVLEWCVYVYWTYSICIQ